MILQPTVTRCGARPIAGDTRESSWPMVSQPSKTRRSRHSGLIIFCGKASDIDLLLTWTPGPEGFGFLGFGGGFIGFVFHRETAGISIPRDMNNAIA